MIITDKGEIRGTKGLLISQQSQYVEGSTHTHAQEEREDDNELKKKKKKN